MHQGNPHSRTRPRQSQSTFCRLTFLPVSTPDTIPPPVNRGRASPKVTGGHPLAHTQPKKSGAENPRRPAALVMFPRYPRGPRTRIADVIPDALTPQPDRRNGHQGDGSGRQDDGTDDGDLSSSPALDLPQRSRMPPGPRIRTPGRRYRRRRSLILAGAGSPAAATDGREIYQSITKGTNV